LKDQIEIFRKIINGKKNNFIDFTEFYEEIFPINPDTGLDMEYDEFINYIEDNNKIKLNFNNNILLSWNDFEFIILCLDKNISKIILNYKKVYNQAINTLLLALKTIIELIQQINKTKKYIPQYISQLLSIDIINFVDKKLLNNIYEQLSNYKK
jgi:3'-phosphoadenosine 5'-phosphosulfate sulfotransferase